MSGTSQKTEKFLLGTLSVLLLVLVFNFYTNESSVVAQVASAESQDGGGSGDDEADSGNSANSEDEESEPSTVSVPSEKSAPSTTQTGIRATSVVDAVSEKSTSQQGVSVASVDDGTGQLTQESVKSLKSEDSSIAAVSTEGKVSLVKRDGRLFFLIPVEIESQVTTNETGTIIAEQRNFLNWLKAVFSF